ncbi:MAG: hypothetical protein LBH43_07285 [Treponema sp.]|jgi:hypothetical protein|nr:hypothetical protein [Treponema sp.]
MSEKEKAPQSGELIRGANADNLTIAKKGYTGKIPPAVIAHLEREILDVVFGGVSLIVAIRNGQPSFRIEKTVSLMTGDVS